MPFLNVIARARNPHFQNNLVTNLQFPREAILLAERTLARSDGGLLHNYFSNTPYLLFITDNLYLFKLIIDYSNSSISLAGGKLARSDGGLLHKYFSNTPYLLFNFIIHHLSFERFGRVLFSDNPSSSYCKLF